jgi:lysophospholipase L1-like esterase
VKTSFTFFAALALALAPLRAEPLVQPNDLVVIAGDSITQQRIYSVFIEDYLLMCQPVPGVHTLQYGFNGAPIGNLRERTAFLATIHANVVTMMYGFNDGQYKPLNDERAKAFHDGNISTIENLKKAGLRTILVGSPSCADWKDLVGRKMYNTTLASLGDISREVAQREGVNFTDVHGMMAAAQAKGDASSPAYTLGGDGAHVGPAGHLMLAYGFLKGLGFDGAIGTITVDLAANKAEGTPGQKIISCKDGIVEVESSRYPFCFFKELKMPESMATVPDTATTLDAVKYVPFNEELNRYLLVVHGLKTPRAKVTWGTQTQEFAAADLEKGVNLAAAFIPDNPFSEQFAKVHAAVRAQQDQEVFLTKEYATVLDRLKKALSSQTDAFDQILKSGIDQHRVLSDAAAALVIPIHHTLKIEPLP